MPSSVPSPEPVIGTEVTPATSLAARAALEEAVRLDPRSALAWSQLATCYISDYKNRWNEAGLGAVLPSSTLPTAVIPTSQRAIVSGDGLPQ